MAIKRPARKAAKGDGAILMGTQDTELKGDSTYVGRTRMGFRMPVEVRDALEAESRETGVPMTTIVVRALEEHLGMR